MQDDDSDEAENQMYRVQGSLREWVTRDEVRRFIARKFKGFLLTYTNPRNDHGDIEYVRQINEMVSGKLSFGIKDYCCVEVIVSRLNVNFCNVLQDVNIFFFMFRLASSPAYFVNYTVDVVLVAKK